MFDAAFRGIVGLKSMNRAEIETIIGRVLNGDIDAYAEIVRAYQQEVWRIAVAMLLSGSKTEDLVQQTFINAFQHLDRFERGRDFGVWLKEIARNQVRQEIRRLSREDHRLELYRDSLTSKPDLDSPSAQEAALEEALARCSEKLPPAGAKLVRLRYEPALGFSEIAALSGRTVEATRQHLARIRLALRECIQKHLARI